MTIGLMDPGLTMRSSASSATRRWDTRQRIQQAPRMRERKSFE
jgi:hypothetical protein